MIRCNSIRHRCVILISVNVRGSSCLLTEWMRLSERMRHREINEREPEMERESDSCNKMEWKRRSKRYTEEQYMQCAHIEWAHQKRIATYLKNYLEEELKYNTMNNVGINLTYKYLKYNRFDDTFDLTILCDVCVWRSDKQKQPYKWNIDSWRTHTHTHGHNNGKIISANRFFNKFNFRIIWRGKRDASHTQLSIDYIFHFWDNFFFVNIQFYSVSKTKKHKSIICMSFSLLWFQKKKNWNEKNKKNAKNRLIINFNLYR